jgi:hypothetical protein
MTRNDWKELLETTGMVAVILSLVLVAYELRQNTLMMKAQINQDRAQLAVTEQQGTFNSEFMPGILVKLSQGEALTEEDMVRYRTYIRGFLRNQDNAYWQYRQGLLGENIPYSIRDAVRETIGNFTVSRQIWDSQKHTYTPEFVALVEDAITEAN